MKKIIRRLLRPPHHSVYFENLQSSFKEGPNLIKLLKKFHENQFILNIGSLSKKVEYGKGRIINLDISYYPNVDLVADGHNLPFKKNSLDGIIIKNVFEHLKDPAKTREETRRVLKKRGKMYAKVPFIQPFHAVPDDYQRFTQSGLREFFKDFKIVEEGISVGPSSAIAWLLQEYMGILFSFNTNRGYNIAKNIFGYITAPIKYFDIFLRRNKEAYRLTSAFYVILEK